MTIRVVSLLEWLEERRRVRARALSEALEAARAAEAVGKARAARARDLVEDLLHGPARDELYLDADLRRRAEPYLERLGNGAGEGLVGVTALAFGLRLRLEALRLPAVDLPRTIVESLRHEDVEYVVQGSEPLLRRLKKADIPPEDALEKVLFLVCVLFDRKLQPDQPATGAR